jgi:hypothetical protein
MTVCALCGDGRRLRRDHEHDRWVCFHGCTSTTTRSTTTRTRPRRKRPALFDAYWRDGRGVRLERATAAELREAWRLWTAHSDVRGGRVRA